MGCAHTIEVAINLMGYALELLFIIDTHWRETISTLDIYIYLLYMAPFMTWVFEFTSHFQF